MARIRGILVVGVLVVLGAACSGSVQFSFGGQSAAEAAVDLIESEEMAQRLMVDPITGAMCDDPPNEDEGTTFACTATSGEDVVEFEVLIEPDDRIFAGPTNVVSADQFQQYEEGAVDALNAQNDFLLELDSIDCGRESVVLDNTRQLDCVLTDADVQYETVITVTDTIRGVFEVEILDVIE